MVRRLRAGLLCALVAFASAGPVAPVSAAAGDKVLSRVKGSVGYQLDQTAPVRPVFGPVDVPDDAYAVTQAGSRALLALRDSSQIDIGERTSVRVGAFSAPGATQTGNQIVLDRGAVKFTIRHPQGTRSNYTFTTPTSQIAVRGTEAYLIVGPNGTQLVCVDCPPGDVTVTINGQTVALVSGQTLTITGTTPANAQFNVGQSGPINPAMQQFIETPQTLGSDPTGYVLALGAANLLLPIAIGSLVVGAVAVSGNTKTGTSSNSVQPSDQPTPSPTPVVTGTPSPTATPTSAPTSTPTVPPGATPTPTPLVTATPTPTPSPTPTPAGTQVPFGNLVVSPTSLTFDAVPQTKTFTVQQTGAGGTITIGQPNCNGDGASASVSPNSAPVSPNGPPTTISVTAQAAPTQSPPPTHACQITVYSNAGLQTATVTLDIHVTTIGINKHGAPSASPSPSPVPRKTH